MSLSHSQSAVRRTGDVRIVAIGGGTGLSTMLRGLKYHTRNLTAIVTVADDGGGSGALREDLGMPPPGDIRHCMEALANAEPVMEELLAYRFPADSGRLSGQSFGNLILAALNGISPSFDQAVERMSQVLAITGRVLPVTNEDVQLEAIAQAELILLGPGSLYTSVIPNLLVEGISEAVCASKAMKMYICNIMTQDGETEGMTASEHVAALLQHSGPGLVQMCLCNSAPVRPGLLERYKEEDAVPIVVDKEKIEAMGVEVITRPVSSETSNYARHSTTRLAQAIMDIYRERASTRIFD